MAIRTQSVLLLILICILAACSERNDDPLVETDSPKELVEGGTPQNHGVVNTDEHHLNEPVEADSPNELDTPTFRLAAWNIRIFSNGSRNDEELYHIAKVLIGYDFIAIVELRDEVVLIRTEAVLEGMGRDYDYVISPPVGAKVKERYAFLFDPEIVHVIENGEVFPDPQDVFLREPYFATFKAGEFDFTAIAVHVIWGDAANQRQREVQELANVYQAVQAANKAEQDMILLGDFNRNPNDQRMVHCCPSHQYDICSNSHRSPISKIAAYMTTSFSKRTM